MNSARERLTQASHKLAEAMYKSAQPSGGAQPGGGFPGAGASTEGGGASSGQEQKKDEGVIDAEYVDVEPKR
jgi:molecular chaperone DnaK